MLSILYHTRLNKKEVRIEKNAKIFVLIDRRIKLNKDLTESSLLVRVTRRNIRVYKFRFTVNSATSGHWLLVRGKRVW